VKLAAGGEDNEKKGKTLKVQGESYIYVLSGHGAAQSRFLQDFAQNLPVRIEGFSAEAAMVEQPENQRLASLFDGRLGEILKARSSDSSETTEYDSVRKPMSCDFVTEFVFVCVMILCAWYVFATLGTLMSWAVRRGTQKCTDPLKPGEDMCEVWRIFVPISTPIANPSDYLNVVLIVCGFIAVPLWYISSMKMEHRFHKNGVMQEVLLAGWESQSNTMVFSSDVEGLELVDGSMEKYLKMQVKAFYSIKGGIKKPLNLTANFAPTDLKLTLQDRQCASCSGHGQAAAAHWDGLLKLADEFKPGLLHIENETPNTETLKATEKSEQPVQTDMPNTPADPSSGP